MSDAVGTGNGTGSGAEVGPKIDHEAIERSYAGKLCPILSLATLGAPQQRIVTSEPAAQGSRASGCQGPSCMFFKLVANEKGEVVSGDCAIPLLVTALTGGQQALAQGQLAIMGTLSHLANGGKKTPFRNIKR